MAERGRFELPRGFNPPNGLANRPIQPGSSTSPYFVSSVQTKQNALKVLIHAEWLNKGSVRYLLEWELYGFQGVL